MRLKPITKVFLVGKIFDVVTTFIGLSLIAGMVELNPGQSSWATLILANAAAVVVVCFALEKVKKWPKLVWIIPAIVWIVVAWNILNIVTCL